MKTYLIKAYYAWDCCSYSGFNDGHYLQDMEITAETEDFAMEVAKDLIFENYGPDNLDKIEDQGNDIYQWVTVYYDQDGNTLSKEEYLSLDYDALDYNEYGETPGGYLYKYLRFEVETIGNRAVSV